MEHTKILICGKRCTGKTTLFWDLQKELGWPTFTVSQFIRDYIHRHHLTPAQIDEKSEAISHDMEERITKLLTSDDHMVIDARVYGKIQEVPTNTLKVLLTASDQARVVRAAYREQTSTDKQKMRLIPRESEWIEKMQKIYPNLDFFNPILYDISIDTTMKTPQEVLHMVLGKM